MAHLRIRSILESQDRAQEQYNDVIATCEKYALTMQIRRKNEEELLAGVQNEPIPDQHDEDRAQGNRSLQSDLFGDKSNTLISRT